MKKQMKITKDLIGDYLFSELKEYYKGAFSSRKIRSIVNETLSMYSEKEIAQKVAMSIFVSNSWDLVE